MHKIHYSEIARELTEGITGGRFAVGTLLPTELELCSQFNTSRHTVRAALHELQRLGLVSRRKNVGTRVETDQPAGSYQQALASVEDLAQFGASHVRLVRNIEEMVADIDVARDLGCPGGTRWLRISSVRVAGGGTEEPIGWTDVYIEPTYAEIGKLIRESPQTLISSLIETKYSRCIARIWQEIQAVSVPASLAQELQVEPGSPALKIVRRYIDSAHQVFEVSVSIHPANRFTFLTELTRDVRR